MDGLATTLHGAGSSVNFQVMNTYHRVLDLMPPSNQRPQPCQQLFELEGLGQIIIGPQVQTTDFILDPAV